MKNALIPGLCFLILINGSCSYTGRNLERENIQKLNGEYNLVNHPYEYKQYEDLTPTQGSTIGKKTILDKHHKYFSTADEKRRNHRKPKNDKELTRRASLLSKGKNHSQAHTAMPTSNVRMTLGWIPRSNTSPSKVPSVSATEVIRHDGSSDTSSRGSKEEVTLNQGMTLGKNTIANLYKRQNQFPVPAELRQNHQAPKNDKELTKRAFRMGNSKSHSQVTPTSNVRMPFAWIPWSDATSKEPSASAAGAIEHDGSSRAAHQGSKEGATPNQAPSTKQETSPWHRDLGKEKSGKNLTNHSGPPHIKDHSQVLHIILPTSNVRIPLKWIPWVDEEPPKPNNHIPYGSEKPAQLDRQVVNPFQEKPIDTFDPEISPNHQEASTAGKSDISLNRTIENILVPSKGDTDSKSSVLHVPDQSKSTTYKKTGSGHKENISSNFMTRWNTPSIDKTEGHKVQNSGMVDSIQNISDQSKTTTYTEKGSDQNENNLSNPTEQHVRQQLLSTDNANGRKVEVTGPINMHVPDQPKSTTSGNTEAESGQQKNISTNPMPRTTLQEQYNPSKDSVKGHKVQVTGPIKSILQVPDQSKSTPYAPIEKGSGLEGQNLSLGNKETFGYEKSVSEDKTTKPNNTWGQHGLSKKSSISTIAKNPKERRIRKLINGFLTGIKDATAGVLSSTVKKIMGIVKGYERKSKPTNIHYTQRNNTQGQISFIRKGSMSAPTRKPRERTLRRLINGFLREIIRINPVRKIKSSQLNITQKRQGPIFTTTNKPPKRRTRALIESFLTGIKDIAAGARLRKT